MFFIKDGSEKDIQIDDFVEVLGQELPYDETDGYEYLVISVDDEAQQVEVETPYGNFYVDSSLVDHVWREI